jgi:RimJ/RimL family protein N-acetyltransferase
MGWTGKSAKIDIALPGTARGQLQRCILPAVTMSNGRELFTQRLHLRCPVEADASAIIAIAGDWDVARRLGRVPHPYTQADFRFFIERVVPSEPTWAIVGRRSAELVGVIGLVPHGESRSAELGYYVGRPHWGQGLATEAAQAIVRMALEVYGYAKLTSGYYADNPASGRVLAKLGFKAVGRSNRPCLAEGKDKPSIEVELMA